MSMPIESMPTSDENRLRDRIAEEEGRLSGLSGDLRAVDAQLEGLGEQRDTYELLERTCGALEQLEELGAAELFWGDGSPGRTAEHINAVRGRADAYLGRVGEIEQRRSALVDEIKRGQDVLDILEADLYDLKLEEEEKNSEWVVERELTVPVRPSQMPWSSGEDDRRLRKSLSTNLLLALILGIVFPMIDLPLPDLQLIPEVPERFAKLIEKAPPPPPPQVEEPPPEEAPPEEPIVAEELPDEVVETPAEPAPPTEEEPAPERQVRSAGILAFRESFAKLENRTPSQLGASARINDAGEAAVGRNERAMVTSQAPGSSGGINLASLSRDVGGGGTGDDIEGVAVSRVASSIGVSGNGDRPMAAGMTAGRTDEEIQIVFDRYKAALYRLYNRELRNNPTLRGQVVLKLTIEPDGSVSFCDVESSDMGAPALEKQIADRVKTFDFGAKEGISAVTILYPIDFLPAG